MFGRLLESRSHKRSAVLIGKLKNPSSNLLPVVSQSNAASRSFPDIERFLNSVCGDREGWGSFQLVVEIVCIYRGNRLDRLS